MDVMGEFQVVSRAILAQMGGGLEGIVPLGAAGEVVGFSESAGFGETFVMWLPDEESMRRKGRTEAWGLYEERLKLLPGPPLPARYGVSWAS